MNTQYLTHQSGRIAYDEQGSGPLIICAPSVGDVRAEYRFLTPYLLAAGYRVVTVDLRGMGESSVGWNDYSVASVGRDLVALIEHLGEERALIIGTSLAAGAAIWAAAEAPARMSGMVLIGPAVHGEVNLGNALFYRALFMRPWGVKVWQWFYATLYPTRKPADFASYSAALGVNLKERGRIESVLAMALASKRASEERLSLAKSPALVVMGSKDPDFPKPEEEAKWVANAVGGRYVMIDGAGHYPHAEMPEVTAPLIIDFLQTATTGAYHHGA
jgi:pimeloyl-ACP methyl ester carboxylesterase